MADLDQLASDLKRIDYMIVDLTRRRMDVARLVGFEKARKRQPMYRANVEDDRLNSIADYAAKGGVNPHVARTILYTLINESCKQQIIQLQTEAQTNPEALVGEERRNWLRSNLLRLAEAIAPSYDALFYDGIFSKLYSTYELARLSAQVTKTKHRGLALDFGCGTGRVSVLLGRKFEQVVGYDVSQDMLYYAALKAEREKTQNVSFECLDVESGLSSIKDESASFINMNWGTASDFLDIERVLSEVRRVLMPGGGLFMSFYNRDSIVQTLGFLPWKTGQTSTLNPYTECLEVNFGGQEYSIHAKPYKISEISNLVDGDFEIVRWSSYPFLSSILPVEILEALESNGGLTEFDNQILKTGEPYRGTYLICEAFRKSIY